MQLVRTHLHRIEEFGIVTFEMRKITSGPGRPETDAVLNEYQASLLLNQFPTPMETLPIIRRELALDDQPQ